MGAAQDTTVLRQRLCLGSQCQALFLFAFPVTVAIATAAAVAASKPGASNAVAPTGVTNVVRRASSTIGIGSGNIGGVATRSSHA
jgi:hypothetical protein